MRLDTLLLLLIGCPPGYMESLRLSFSQPLRQGPDPSAIRSFTHFDCCHSLSEEEAEASCQEPEAEEAGSHVARFRGALQWKQTDICLTLEIDCHPSRELPLSSGWVIEWQGCAVCISNLHAYPVYLAPSWLPCPSPQNIWPLAWIYIQLRARGFIFPSCRPVCDSGERLWRLWLSHSTRRLTERRSPLPGILHPS